MLSTDTSSYAFNHSVLDEDPRLSTETGFRNFVLSKYGQRAGYSAPTGEGFLKEGWQGIRRAFGRAGTGIAKTALTLAGDDEASRLVDADRAEAVKDSPWTAPIDYGSVWDNLKTDPGSWLGQTMGEGIGSSLPYVGFGVLGGMAGRGIGGAIGKAITPFTEIGRAMSYGETIAKGASIGMKVGQYGAQLGGSFGLYQGENYLELMDEAKRNGVTLNSKAAYTIAAFKTAIDGIIEMGIGGVESQAARNALSRGFAKRLGKDVVARETLESAAHAGFFGKYFGSASWLGRTVLQAGEEGGEEIFQGLNDLAFKHLFAGKTVDFATTAMDLVEAGVTGFVGGLGMGGFTEMTRLSSERRLEHMGEDLSAKEEAKAQSLLGSEGYQKSVEAFEALKETLPDDFKDAGTIIRNVAFKMALETGKKPEEYINELKTLFLDENNLPASARAKFVANLHAKGANVTELLKKTFPGYEDIVRSAAIQGRVRTLRMANDAMSRNLAEDGIVPLDESTEAGKAKVGTISAWIAGQSTEKANGEGVIRISREQASAWVEANPALAKEWYASGSIDNVTIGGGKYNLYLTERGVAAIPSGDVKVEQQSQDKAYASGSDAGGSAIELAKETRRHKRIGHAIEAQDSFEDFRKILGQKQGWEYAEEAMAKRKEEKRQEDFRSEMDRRKAAFEAVRALPDTETVDDSVVRMQANDVAYRTDTPEFKAWFGNSKVVNRDGTPMVMYHGTVGDFSTFRKKLSGIWLAYNPSSAEPANVTSLRHLPWIDGDGISGLNVMPLYVKAERIRQLTDSEFDSWKHSSNPQGWIRDFRQRDGNWKYDAVKIGDYALVVFRQEQIKSSIGNNGSFDKSNPDIRMQDEKPSEPIAPKGFYDPRTKLAVFLSKADSGTVIHEWVHHVVEENLLPGNLRSVFMKNYGSAGGEDAGLTFADLKKKYPQATDTDLLAKMQWTNRAEEHLAQSFLLWIRDGTTPTGASDEMMQAFDRLKKQFATSYKVLTANYSKPNIEKDPAFQASAPRGEDPISFNEETKAELSKLFDSVTEDDLGKIYGTLAAETLHEGRVGHGADPATADAAFQSSLDAVMQNEKGESDDRRLQRWFFRSLGRYADKAGITKDQAKQMILERYGHKDFSSVPPDVKIRMARDLDSWAARSSRARSVYEMSSEKARELQASVISMNDGSPRSLKYESVMEGSRANAVKMRNAVRWLRSKMIEYVDDRYSIVDSVEKDANGPLHQLFSQLEKADDVKSALKIKYQKILNDFENRMGAFPKDLDSNVSIAGTMMKKAHVLSIYTHANAGEGDWQRMYAVQQMIRSNGLTPEQIKAAIEFVKNDPASKRLVDASQALFAEIYPAIAEEVQKVTGKPMGKIKTMYLPMLRKNGMIGEDDFLSMLSDPSGPNIFRNEQDVENARLSWMQGRGTDGTKMMGPLDLDFPKALVRYYSQAANYIGSAMAVKNALTVLSDSNVAASFNRRYGAGSGVYKTLVDIVRRDLSYNGRTDPYGSAERVLGFVKNNAYMSLLSWNPYTVLNQLLSLPASFAILPKGDMVKAMQNFIDLTSMAAFSKGDAGGIREGSRFSQDPRVRLMAEKAPHILMRMSDQQVEEWSETHGSAIGRTGIRINKNWTLARAIELGLVPMINTDMAVTVAIWHSAYSGQMRIAEKNGMAPELADKAAVEFANSVVRQSQNPSIYSERGMFQTKSEIYKMFIPFSGQAFAAFKYNYKNFVMPILEGMDEGGARGAIKAAGRQLVNPANLKKMAFYNVLPAMLFTMIALRRVPKEDEFFKGLLIYPAMSLPVIGPILWTAALSGFASGDTTLMGGALKGVAQAAKDVGTGKVFGEPSKSLGRLSTTVSGLIGLPQWPRKLVFSVVDEMAKTELSGKFRETDPIYKNFKASLLEVRDALKE